jgi:hypothetical protein
VSLTDSAKSLAIGAKMTSNELLWQTFEPELQRRISKLEGSFCRAFREWTGETPEKERLTASG